MSAATTTELRPPLADVSTLKLARIDGLSSAGVARAKGWGVGTVLEGTETWPGGSDTSRIVITAIGERCVLARRVDDTARSETSWTFACRDWHEVL